MATERDLERLGVAPAEVSEEPEGCRGVFVMTADAAIFRDHFPGEPLLPAIGILDLCRHLLGRWLGPEARLIGLRRFRLSQAVRPPVRLEIGLRGASGRVSMIARSPAGEHAAGDLVWTPAGSTPGAERPETPASALAQDDPEARPGADGATGNEAGRPPDPSCLPHGPGMRLVAGIESWGEDRIVGACRIPADFPWGRQQALPPYLALEGIAQMAGVLAAAVMTAEAAGDPGATPRRGYITRIREAAFPGPDLDPERPWLAEIDLLGGSGGLVLCRGRAVQGGRELLSARLGLYVEASGQSR